MQTPQSDLIALEKKFWQSLVDDDADTAVAMLDEPAIMVSSHGAMQFDHAKYRQMAEHGTMKLKSYKLGDIDVTLPTKDTAVLTYRVKQTVSVRDKPDLLQQEMTDSSVWTRKDGQWRCVMHTETPIDAKVH
jgi:hypothetical protein